MFRFIIIFFLLLGYSASADFVEGRVTSEKLNARVFPGLGYTCVCILEKGEKLKILGKSGEWYQIEAPASASVWLSNSFVNGSTALKGAKFRAGPSVAYEIYDKASEDVKIERAEESEEYWTRIKPTTLPILKAWVNSKFVSINKQDTNNIVPLETTAEASSSSKEDNANKTSLSTGNAASEKKENELIFVAGLPKTVALDGILMPLEKQENLITHSINIKVNDEFYMIAYAYSMNDNLKLWEKRKVRIKGIQKWIKNWKRPIIEIEKISPMWQ